MTVFSFISYTNKKKNEEQEEYIKVFLKRVCGWWKQIKTFIENHLGVESRNKSMGVPQSIALSNKVKIKVVPRHFRPLGTIFLFGGNNEEF